MGDHEKNGQGVRNDFWIIVNTLGIAIKVHCILSHYFALGQESREKV